MDKPNDIFGLLAAAALGLFWQAGWIVWLPIWVAGFVAAGSS
jgi:hypothetical protein